jgi:hypothetical protein
LAPDAEWLLLLLLLPQLRIPLLLPCLAGGAERLLLLLRLLRLALPLIAHVHCLSRLS